MIDPRRACNIAYYHFIQEADPEERKKFDSELYAPTKGKSLMQSLDEISDNEVDG